MDEMLKWVDAHQGTAAWVQAIGAIVAMGLTLLLWWSDRSSRRDLADARARASALVLLPPLTQHNELLTWARDQLEAGRHASEIGTDGPDNDIALWHIDPFPQRLVEIQGSLADLGPAAASVQRAFFALQNMDEERRLAQEGWEWEQPDDRGYTADQLNRAKRHLNTSVSDTANALAALRQLFE